jgi:hypothetical protein
MSWQAQTPRPYEGKMPRSRKDLEALLEGARMYGYHEGFDKGRQLEAGKQPVRDAQIKLMNAVGQTLQAQASLVQGLGQALDCGPS